MGKAKKNKMATGGARERNAPLAAQITEDKTVRAPGRSKAKHLTDEQEDKYIDEKLSKRILAQALQQQDDLEEEHGGQGGKAPRSGAPAAVKLGGGDSDQDDSDDNGGGGRGDDHDGLAAEDLYEDLEIDAGDEAALARFMSANPPARRTLADIIMDKITEKKTEIDTEFTDNQSVRMEDVDERVVAMYADVKAVLTRYRSGKLPKAFKIIPCLSNWEQILYLTEPETWTAAAVYQATRIFSSNLNAKMAQRFYHLVLLPRIRDDIQEFKRLNFHLYMAVKKSLFKPAAFFKGLLLPLCESGTCTLREAIIMASVLQKCSIPMLHSAAGLLKIAEMEYTGAASIFLRTLLDKKYALPYRVVDAVVHHFVRFTTDQRTLPVLWHQALLTFAQRYKDDVSSEQREALLALLRAHVHEQITPEIRRELQGAKCRDAAGVEPPLSRTASVMEL